MEVDFDMKKRTAFVGAILCLIPLGQPLIIQTGVVLSTTALMLYAPEKARAEDGDFYFNRGNDKKRKGDFYGAISDYTKAIEINPNDDDAFYNRGNSKNEIKDYYGSIYDYTKAIEIDSSQPDVFFNRGLSKKYVGDDKGACSDWRKALSLGYKPASKVVRDQC